MAGVSRAAVPTISVDLRRARKILAARDRADGNVLTGVALAVQRNAEAKLCRRRSAISERSPLSLPITSTDIPVGCTRRCRNRPRSRNLPTPRSKPRSTGADLFNSTSKGFRRVWNQARSCWTNARCSWSAVLCGQKRASLRWHSAGSRAYRCCSRLSWWQVMDCFSTFFIR